MIEIENPMYLATPDDPLPVMTLEEITAKYGNGLPDDAIRALQVGDDWDGMPQTAGDFDAWYNYCDGERGHEPHWTRDYYPSGIVIEDGKAWLRYDHVDTDGNWEYCDMAEFGTPEAAALEQEYGPDNWLANQREYSAWVAENGEDPMGEFFVKSHFEVEQSWRAEFQNSILGCVLVRAKSSRGQWSRPEDIPSDVRAFLGCTHSPRGGRYITGDFASCAELVDLIKGSSDLKQHRSKTGVVVGFRVKATRPNPRYVVELKRLARKAARLTK